ncbi:MAG: hypothetical protein IJC86_03110 [Clostridia bacterium]|nr:hypothetical protein [Clostridia bacterium]
MKRITAIILLALCALCALSGCKSEADMVETMISTMMPTESTGGNTTVHNSGTVTDGDGVIGNDDQENSTASGNTGSQGTNNASSTSNNVL